MVGELSGPIRHCLFVRWSFDIIVCLYFIIVSLLTLILIIYRINVQ